jgi:hypothetical protein
MAFGADAKTHSGAAVERQKTLAVDRTWANEPSFTKVRLSDTVARMASLG